MPMIWIAAAHQTLIFRQLLSVLHINWLSVPVTADILLKVNLNVHKTSLHHFQHHKAPLHNFTMIKHEHEYSKVQWFLPGSELLGFGSSITEIRNRAFWQILAFTSPDFSTLLLCHGHKCLGENFCSYYRKKPKSLFSILHLGKFETATQGCLPTQNTGGKGTVCFF